MDLTILTTLVSTFLALFIDCSDSREPVGQNLVVLLIDGYGASLFNRTDAKLQFGTQMLLNSGVQAESMKPVFPTQSYPNWLSLATGLYVENHNFTSDFMYDPEGRILFQRDQGINDSDARWWKGLPPPLWYTVGMQAIDVHCYWFATCHRPHIDQVVQVPSIRRHSFKDMDEHDLFEYLPKIMQHIKKYQSYRQQLVLLRFDGLARALRSHGEESNIAVQALSNVDAQIRKIQEEMESHDLVANTNLVVLSDHGLMRVEEEDQFYVEECLADFSKVERVVNSLSFMMVFPKPGQEDTIFFELKICDQWAPVGDYDSDEVPLVSVYRRHEIPERYRWKDARFIAPIIMITRPGVILLTRQLPSTDIAEKSAQELKMLGGWDNEHPEMQGIFMARGPAFKVDFKTEPIEIVDVYQVLLNVLGVEPDHPNNGSWERVESLLSDGWEDRKYEHHRSKATTYSVSTMISTLIACLTVFLFTSTTILQRPSA